MIFSLVKIIEAAEQLDWDMTRLKASFPADFDAQLLQTILESVQVIAPRTEFALKVRMRPHHQSGNLPGGRFN